MADDLQQYLEGLADDIREPIAAALREQAEMLSEAQRATLRSLERFPAETGALEDSCTTAPGANDLEVIVQAGGDGTTDDVRAGSGVPYHYAEAFEFGTSHQHARPFFYSTYREKRDDMQAAISAAIEEAFK